MQKFVSKNIWREIAELAKKSGAKKAAIAYVTTDAEIKFGEGDLLIVDASDGAIASGETSATVLERASANNAEIYSCPGLHAKVLLLDDIAIIGSANLSLSSRDNLIEAALFTDQPRAVAGLASFLYQLKSTRFSDRVDETFIKRIKKIPVIRRGRTTPSQRKRGSPRFSDSQVWVVTTSDLPDEAFPHENELVERGAKAAALLKQTKPEDLTWIRWTIPGRFRRQARANDVIINIARDSWRSKPYAVYKSLPILARQEEAKCTRFYLEFTRQMESECLTWSEFKRLCASVKLPRRVVPGSVQQIPREYADAMFSVWDKFRE